MDVDLALSPIPLLTLTLITLTLPSLPVLYIGACRCFDLNALASGSLAPILRLLHNTSTISFNQDREQPTRWGPMW